MRFKTRKHKRQIATLSYKKLLLETNTETVSQSRKSISIIINDFLKSSQSILILNGPPGSGKSFSLLNHFKEKHILNSATIGRALSKEVFNPIQIIEECDLLSLRNLKLSIEKINKKLICTCNNIPTFLKTYKDKKIRIANIPPYTSLELNNYLSSSCKLSQTVQQFIIKKTIMKSSGDFRIFKNLIHVINASKSDKENLLAMNALYQIDSILKLPHYQLVILAIAYNITSSIKNSIFTLSMLVKRLSKLKKFIGGLNCFSNIGMQEAIRKGIKFF